MFDSIWSTINWLAITVPFGIGFFVSEILKEKKIITAKNALYWPLLLGISAVLFLFEYFIYKASGFPAWMRWFV